MIHYSLILHTNLLINPFYCTDWKKKRLQKKCVCWQFQEMCLNFNWNNDKIPWNRWPQFNSHFKFRWSFCKNTYKYSTKKNLCKIQWNRTCTSALNATVELSNLPFSIRTSDCWFQREMQMCRILRPGNCQTEFNDSKNLSLSWRWSCTYVSNYMAWVRLTAF